MLPHSSKSKKLNEVISSIAYTEDKKTSELFVKLSRIREKGYLTKRQLLSILKWKSPRPLKHYSSNTAKETKLITQLAFSTKNDCLKIHILTALNGVSYPSASAILMFYDSRKFPVIDIRVWKQLFALKIVTTNSRGQGFTLRQCESYFSIIRKASKELKITARQAEKCLFDYDKKNQIGTLYR